MTGKGRKGRKNSKGKKAAIAPKRYRRMNAWSGGRKKGRKEEHAVTE